MRARFADCFASAAPPFHRLPDNVYHCIRLKDADMMICCRTYDCPKHYTEAWQCLIAEHIEGGHLRPSDSLYALLCFLIPKADPNDNPHWVNDFHALNDNTIPDAYPLPTVQSILADCGKGKIWAKINMTNAFFQTRVHPDDIKYTAVTTPFGLYEWTVMPQRLRNAPATHQQRMFNALHPYIGRFCHVYLDDIIIWSDNLEEHRKNVATVLTALQKAGLICSPKKTALFCLELDFLGHHISQKGIEADGKKVEKVLDWPIPRSASEVCRFLGLVCYISNFLPALAKHTQILNALTMKEAEKSFVWTNNHTSTFESIKPLVTSRECLTIINHNHV